MSSRPLCPGGDSGHMGQPESLAECGTQQPGFSCHPQTAKSTLVWTVPQRPWIIGFQLLMCYWFWIKQSFPVVAFISVFWHFLLHTSPTGACPLFPVPICPSLVFLPFFSCPQLGDSVLARGRKTNILCPYQLLATFAQMLRQAHTRTYTHTLIFLSLSFSL